MISVADGQVNGKLNDDMNGKFDEGNRKIKKNDFDSTGNRTQVFLTNRLGGKLLLPLMRKEITQLTVRCRMS